MHTEVNIAQEIRSTVVQRPLVREQAAPLWWHDSIICIRMALFLVLPIYGEQALHD